MQLPSLCYFVFPMQRDLSFYCGLRPVKFHHAALRRACLAAAFSARPPDLLHHSAGQNAQFADFRQFAQNPLGNQS
jgi:hypothetical protein